MSIRTYTCGICKYYFDYDRRCGNNINPQYCPICGKEWKIKTPTEIVEEIKAIYHASGVEFSMTTTSEREDRMLKLLNELKEIAEANK